MIRKLPNSENPIVGNMITITPTRSIVTALPIIATNGLSKYRFRSFNSLFPYGRFVESEENHPLLLPLNLFHKKISVNKLFHKTTP